MSNDQHRSPDDAAVAPEPEERLPPEVPTDEVPAEDEGQVGPTVVPQAGAPSRPMDPPSQDPPQDH